MKYLPDLFEQNRAWAQGRVAEDPGFFKRLCDIQQPEYVWIGCADSRVPANQIVGMSPGQLFVHRNVANIVRADDVNCMAVIAYAVGVLRVKHLIVCGHYGCGGVRAALDGTARGVVAEWLEPLRRIVRDHASTLDVLPDEVRWGRLCEINVSEQVRSLMVSDPVRTAWAAGQELTVHGWIYDLHDGLLRDMNVTAHGP
ncbi:MAG TPA: carbonic anhydrase [Thermoanaerobaculia bacterium]|nr:carbonic anhydrase [Thermoanaerobaculia bacterium]